VEAARKRFDRSPDVERALRLDVDGDAELAQAAKQEVALVPERSSDCGCFGARVLGRKELDRRSLHGLRSPAVEETACTRYCIDDLARSDGPGDAPAGVAPILRQAVEQDDGIGIDVLHVPSRAFHAVARAGADIAVDVVRVELVEQERAVEL